MQCKDRPGQNDPQQHADVLLRSQTQGATLETLLEDHNVHTITLFFHIIVSLVHTLILSGRDCTRVLRFLFILT